MNTVETVGTESPPRLAEHPSLSVGQPRCSKTLLPSAHPRRTQNYSTLHSSAASIRPSRNGHSRSRTVPSTTQPEFWTRTAPSEDPHVSSAATRSGHTRNRTDPSAPPTALHDATTRKPNAPAPEPTATKPHRSRDTESVRPVERQERSRRTGGDREREPRDQDREERRRERRQRTEAAQRDVEREARRVAERAPAEPSRPAEVERECERDRGQRDRRRERERPPELDRLPDRPQPSERERERDRDRDKDKDKERERERRRAERDQRHADEKRAKSRARPVPTPSRSYDDNESSDNMRPKLEASSRHKRHRTEDIQEKRPFFPTAPSASLYEAPIRPMEESPLLASFQAHNHSYQLVSTDSDDPERNTFRVPAVTRPGESRSNAIGASKDSQHYLSASRSAPPPQGISVAHSHSSRGTPAMVPVPNFSSSSRERKEDTRGVSTRPDIITKSSPSALNANPSPQNTLNISPSQPLRDSPQNKYSPGKSSLQNKSSPDTLVDKHAVSAADVRPTAAASTSLQSASVPKQSPPKRRTEDTLGSTVGQEQGRTQASERQTLDNASLRPPAVEERTYPAVAHPSARTANFAVGSSIARSSTSMGTRPNEEVQRNAFTPFPPMPSFASNAAAGASIHRPSTAAGFSRASGAATFDPRSLSRVAATESLRDKFATKNAGSRTMSAAQSSIHGPAFPPIPSFAPLPSGPSQTSPRQTQSAASSSIPPPPIAPSTEPLPAERQRNNSNNASTYPTVAEPAKSTASQTAPHVLSSLVVPQIAPPSQPSYPVASSSAERSVPSRDVSTPMPQYRHPVLADLLTSPTNEQKYVAGQSYGLQVSQPQFNQQPFKHSYDDEGVNTPSRSWSTVTDQRPAQTRPAAHEQVQQGHPLAPQPIKYTSSSEAAALHTQRLAENARQRSALGSTWKPAPQAAEAGPQIQRAVFGDPTYARPVMSSITGSVAPQPISFVPPARPPTTVNDPYAPRPAFAAASTNTTVPPPPIHHTSFETHIVSSQPYQEKSAIPPTAPPPALQASSSSSGSKQPFKGSLPNESAMTRTTSHESSMKTPSSLAPTVLKRSASKSSVYAPSGSQNLEPRKKGFFNILRSKVSSAPTQPEAVTPVPENSNHQGSVLPPMPQHQKETEPQATLIASEEATTRQPLSARVQVPPPVTVPPSTPGQMQPSTGNIGPSGGKDSVFSPFKYLASRRKRTMSGASLEAVSGTAANTVVGSPTASMLSSNPMQPPSTRDPVMAAREWREAEGGQSRRNGKLRVIRPGVVFEVKEDAPEDRPRLRSNRSRR